MAFGLRGQKARHEKTILTHNTDSAAPFARSDGLFAQFVAFVAHGKAQVQFLDGVVPGVLNQTGDRVEPVLAVTATPVALVDLQIHPVLALFFQKTAIAQEMHMGRIPGADLVRDGLGEGEVYAVGQILDLIEAAEAGARKTRIENRPLRRNDPYGPKDPLVLRHRIGVGSFIEQDAAHDHVGGDQGAAFKRHVIAGWYLGA